MKRGNLVIRRLAHNCQFSPKMYQVYENLVLAFLTFFIFIFYESSILQTNC